LLSCNLYFPLSWPLCNCSERINIHCTLDFLPNSIFQHSSKSRTHTSHKTLHALQFCSTHESDLNQNSNCNV